MAVKNAAIKDFKLEPGEKIILDISRSKLGLITVWGSSVFLVLVIGIVMAIVFSLDAASLPFDSVIRTSLIIAFIALIIAAIVFGIVGTVVYCLNHLYVTDKRIIQIVVPSIFGKSVNVVELSRIEDVSFKKNGILDYILHMGTLRMSTVGDETTYTFPFTDTPTDEVETIARLVQKNK